MYSVVMYENYGKVIILSTKFENLFNCVRNESELTYLIHEKNSNVVTNEISLKKNYIKIASLLLIATVAAGGSAAAYKINTLTKAVEESQAKLREVEITNSNLMEKTQNLETENSVLQNENTTLESDFNSIIQKADELENRINELNGVKDELYNTLDEMSSIGQKYKETVLAEAELTDEPKKFTTLVYTPLEKTTSLASSLASIESMININSSEFIAAADNVTTTLANNQAEFASKVLEGVTIPSLWPANGRITSGFADRTDPINGGYEYHKGIDISVGTGSPVYATAGGKVVISKYSSSYGYYVVIDHGNEYKTLYAHNSELLVKVGDYVEAGQQIARSGATGNVTGPHVHYEVIENGVNVDPRDFMA